MYIKNVANPKHTYIKNMTNTVTPNIYTSNGI